MIHSIARHSVTNVIGRHTWLTVALRHRRRSVGATSLSVVRERPLLLLGSAERLLPSRRRARVRLRGRHPRRRPWRLEKSWWSDVVPCLWSVWIWRKHRTASLPQPSLDW